jgi:hypothetical protein
MTPLKSRAIKSFWEPHVHTMYVRKVAMQTVLTEN